MKLQYLDQGHVELIDHMGDDRRIVEAARISFKGQPYTDERDTKLIHYLVKHGHHSPLEQVVFVFSIRLPLFIMRQLVRHRTARLNEVSGRYTQLPEEYYIPSAGQLRRQDGKNKQGSGEPISPGLAVEMQLQIAGQCRDAFDLYRRLINSGLSRETARIVLPLNTYTEIVWQMDLNNLLKFFDQRIHPHAQWEMQELGRCIRTLIEPIVPESLKAWEEKKKAQEKS